MRFYFLLKSWRIASREWKNGREWKSLIKMIHNSIFGKKVTASEQKSSGLYIGLKDSFTSDKLLPYCGGEVSVSV